MAAPRLRLQLAVAGLVVTAVLVADSSGLLGPKLATILDDSAQLGGDATVHVNISASRLGNPALEGAVRYVLQRYGLAAQHLVLEVTESSRIPDPPAAVASAERLRASGIRLALDDFGTGYNTLAQLHLLPIDILKLDRTLTTINGTSERLAALCGSMVRIAADLGITVVAEGVETAGQAAALARLGCGFGQGHLYGRPAPMATMAPPAALVAREPT
jgi:diguanylate cyclase